MFSQNRRVAILAFLIAAFLMLGGANGFTELPALTLRMQNKQQVKEAATSTTTTASTATSPAIINDAAGRDLKSEPTTATSATSTGSAAASLRRNEVELATELPKSFGTSNMRKLGTTTESLSADDKHTERVGNQNEGDANANATKIVQIKNSRKQHGTSQQTTTKTTVTATATETLTATITATKATAQPEVTRSGNAAEEANRTDALGATQAARSRAAPVEAALVGKTNEANTIRGAAIVNAGHQQEESTTTPETAAISPTQHHQRKFHVERQLKNGLYRIKLAEIFTDEFNGDATPAVNDRVSSLPVTSHQPAELLSQPAHVAASTSTGNKINIVDLYPLNVEDFKPLIRDSNAKLLRERTIFSQKPDLNAAEYRLNLMPNDLEADQDAAADEPASRSAVAAIFGVNNEQSLPAKTSVNHAAAKVLDTPSPQPHSGPAAADAVSDFTGKLLAEQDGVISEIEQNFHLDELMASESSMLDKKAMEISRLGGDTVKPAAMAAPHEFIDRRVKKSFDFPMHRVASDAIVLPHVDFANTKFNTNANVNVARKGGSTAAAGDKVPPIGSHPEFSTTKFYNSKELYSQMLQQHKDKTFSAPQQQQQQQQQRVEASAGEASVNQAAAINSSLPTQGATATTASNRVTFESGTTILNTSTTLLRLPSAPTKSQTPPHTTLSPTSFSEQFDKESAKILLQTISTTLKVPLATTTTKLTPAVDIEARPTATVTTATTPSASSPALRVTTKAVMASSAVTPTVSSNVEQTTSNAATDLRMTSTPTATARVVTTPAAAASQRTTNPTKSSSRPIARPRVAVVSRLQEKINSLECGIQNVPQDSHLWRGNETHELMLPIVVPKTCKSQDDCSAARTSWDGEAEIQSGDILIVEINDALLSVNEKTKTISAHTTQVYQVTRSGHEHCDVTEGILLDITPLVVDGRKLVTLYDKDLTEGVNLLIVVSELWGSQCVRLKVTTKTDNCGENADCSGKGVCFSNPAMEEYECQCCSGFAGPHCEEIDACTPSPCTNNGICVDLSQGHEGNSYQCLCPYGYTGKNCQYEADPCNPAECMNGGSCVGNSTHFRCDCTPGFAGPLCQHSLNECESSPCVHGICVDQEDGFRCFCQPGFAGELCNFEYNECESNPCQNAGECIDHIGSYECRCTKGYSGSRCQVKVDLCANNPCPAGHRCIDHGNDFSCECSGEQNGLDCNQMTRTQCNVNPCTHGGTCWSSGDSFYCACRPGYTGTMCEDEFVVETVISSSEFMVDDTSARNFNEKTFGSAVVLKSPIELHSAYFGAGVLAAAVFIVAVVVTICHCKVNQTYRKFSTRSTTFFPILGFGRRPKSQNKLNKHWLSGKGLGAGNPLRASSTRNGVGVGGGAGDAGVHLAASKGNQYTTTGSTALQQQQPHIGLAGQLHERPYQRHPAMNLENDMYYTVDYSETSQHSPLIQ